MARQVTFEQVNSVLISGDGWHSVQLGSYDVDDDNATFSFITGESVDPASIAGSVVIGKTSAVLAVRLVSGS